MKTIQDQLHESFAKLFPNCHYFAPCGVGDFNFATEETLLKETQIRGLRKLGYIITQVEALPDKKLFIWINFVRSYDEDFGKLVEREN